MQKVLAILFGAGFTTAVCCACGTVLLRRLRIALDPLETVIFSFLSGAACVSFLVFFLCLAGQARVAVFLPGGVLAIAWALHQRRSVRTEKPLPAIPALWLWMLSLIFTLYFFMYFVNSLAPEVSPDGAGYHLGNVVRYYRQHGFVWDYRSMYSCFPQGIEMLFLVAFAFGKHSAAALVHFAFFVSLPLLMLGFGRRFGIPRPAAFAAILVCVSPVFGITGTAAYNDVALATLIFAVFYIIQVWDDNNCNNLLILCGLLSGFCFAIKYTGGLALGWTLVWVGMRGKKAQYGRILVPAALSVLPWTLRNWFWIGNPLAPFLNRWFANPYFSVTAEKAYLADVGHFESMPHWWRLPLEITLFGGSIPGFLGPAFLLAPLALLALRDRRGRRLLAAAVVFSLPFGWNASTRFLMGAIPFIAMAIGMAIQNSPAVLPAIAVFQGLLCWPGLTPLYCADWSWRLRSIPLRAALRLEPESVSIRRQFPEYALEPIIQSSIFKPQKIFSYSTRPEAYLEATILVGYESAAGLEIQQLLANAARDPTLKRGAGAALRRRNVGFLLINSTDPIAQDLKQNSSIWGVTLLAEADGTRIYRID